METSITTNNQRCSTAPPAFASARCCQQLEFEATSYHHAAAYFHAVADYTPDRVFGSIIRLLVGLMYRPTVSLALLLQAHPPTAVPSPGCCLCARVAVCMAMPPLYCWN